MMEARDETQTAYKITCQGDKEKITGLQVYIHRYRL